LQKPDPAEAAALIVDKFPDFSEPANSFFKKIEEKF
jgi:hypothetical protein